MTIVLVKLPSFREALDRMNANMSKNTSDAGKDGGGGNQVDTANSSNSRLMEVSDFTSSSCKKIESTQTWTEYMVF